MHQRGYCGASAGLEVSSVCLHLGEEPPISGKNGIVNVFFAHCNLQCIFCQNHTISSRDVDSAQVKFRTTDEVAEQICRWLPESSGLVGFVTATHYAPYLPPIVEAVRERGFSPTFVYNSSGYESVDTLRQLEGLIDIYLPDFKYIDPELSARFSHCPDYPETAQAALREMRRQVGGGLKVADGVAYRGIVVRHLVLPGLADHSIQCLEWLADEFPIGLHLSLMAQYFPPSPTLLPPPLDRCLGEDEYNRVVDKAIALGLTDGWIQELDSQQHYRPNFSLDNPFAT